MNQEERVEWVEWAGEVRKKSEWQGEKGTTSLLAGSCYRGGLV